MLFLINNIGNLKEEECHAPKLPTTIVQDSFQINQQTRNIYIQVEPQAIMPVQEAIVNLSNKYDYILTFNDYILSHCKNAYMYIYGTTFLKMDDIDTISKDKKFIITSVTNDKSSAPGHCFRHIVYNNQLQIQSIPTLFYISEYSIHLKNIQNNPILPKDCSSKIELFRDAQFSLVIENSMQKNYFTEKICDCLLTKTIPVYVGCPNISDFFDTTGWIIIENYSLEELIEKLKILTPDYYVRYIDTIEKNFETVKQYADYKENINKCLRSIPGY